MAGADPLLRHVRHAEEWLRRARRDRRRGDVRAAVLRLMLAEAELRHARETQTGESASRQTAAAGRGAAFPRRTAAAIVAAAVLAAGAGYAAARWTAAPPVTAAVPAPRTGGMTRTIVQLDSGRFLTFGQGQNDADESVGGPVHLAVPVDLRTSLPTF